MKKSSIIAVILAFILFAFVTVSVLGAISGQTLSPSGKSPIKGLWDLFMQADFSVFFLIAAAGALLYSKGNEAVMELVSENGWFLAPLLLAMGITWITAWTLTGASGYFTDCPAYVPKSCFMPAGFTCYDFYVNADGEVYFDFGQATGNDIVVTRVQCDGFDPVDLNISLPSGHHAVISSSELGIVKCCDGVEPCTKDLQITYLIKGKQQVATGRVSGPYETT